MPQRIERIEELLANPNVNARTKDFLRSLLHGIERWGNLSEKQDQALNRIQQQHTDEAIARREEWCAQYDDEKRSIAKVCAGYYNATGMYFYDLAARVLEEPDFVPTEKQYNAMCCNKYAKKVVENTFAEPKYPVGSFVSFRANAPRGTLQLDFRLSGLPALVIQADAAPVKSYAKGGKIYLVMPVGSTQPVQIEERYLKQSKKMKKVLDF